MKWIFYLFVPVGWVAERTRSSPTADDLVDALACQVVFAGDLLEGFAVAEALPDRGVAFAV